MSALVATALFCSFIILEHNKEERRLEKNELAYSDKRIVLKFGGFEELIGNPQTGCYRTDIYLSDANLNDAGINSHEEIVLKLQNYMQAEGFEKGEYRVSGVQEIPVNGVKAELLSLNGSLTDLEVTGGLIRYSGDYPAISVTLDLELSDGNHLMGSFDKPLTSFKYFF